MCDLSIISRRREFYSFSIIKMKGRNQKGAGPFFMAGRNEISGGMKMTDRLLTTDQAAKFFGVAPQKMRVWRSHGSGPKYIKLGNSQQSRVRYSPEAIQEFVEQHTFG